MQSASFVLFFSVCSFSSFHSTLISFLECWIGTVSPRALVRMPPRKLSRNQGSSKDGPNTTQFSHLSFESQVNQWYWLNMVRTSICACVHMILSLSCDDLCHAQTDLKCVCRPERSPIQHFLGKGRRAPDRFFSLV